MPFARQDNSEFLAFKQWAEAALQSNPSLMRLDCLNPIKAVQHDFDFSYSPDVDVLEAWEQFLGFPINSYSCSTGVRDSLGSIFDLLNQDGRILSMPADVYPVYQMIARSVGLKYELYPTLPAFDIEVALRTDSVLLTAPLVPLGRDLTVDEVEFVMSWLQKDARCRIIIDRVYDYNSGKVIEQLLHRHSGQVTVCFSLSKTFLSPGEMGLAIVPPEDRSRLPHLKQEFGKARTLLTKYKHFPREQSSIFHYRWGKLAEAIRGIDGDWKPPPTGYLSVVNANSRELLKQGVLAIPGKVYGTGDDLSIITCLHESNRHDDVAVVTRRYVTVLSNFARGYDKYGRTYSKSGIPESTFPDKFYLLGEDLAPGFAKARKLLEKTEKGDRLIVLHTRVKNHELRPNLRNGLGEYVERNYIDVEGVFDEGLREIQIEDAYADSLRLNKLHDWHDVKPRSLSVLPIALACQCRCAFCFSHSSVSEDQRQGRVVLEALDRACIASLGLGAERLVITGGGEPTLMAHVKLLDVMRVGGKHFKKIVMITNGLSLGHNPDRREHLKDYAAAGLTVLSISRHSHDRNTEIMKQPTWSELIAEDVLRWHIPLTLRWVCVLQKGGVENEKSLREYLDWVVDTGVREVCFKELYVAVNSESEYHNSTYNAWSREHQVPLKLIVDFLHQNNARKVAELPWGSPVYVLQWKGQQLKIAAYTEPSVFWERSRGLCRSWNLMADGTCYANLETTASQVNAGGRYSLV